MTLMMSENFSAMEALKAVHIVDTVIWEQTRHLPLRLDKLYINFLQLLKKMDIYPGTKMTLQIIYYMILMLMTLLLA